MRVIERAAVVCVIPILGSSFILRRRLTAAILLCTGISIGYGAENPPAAKTRFQVLVFYTSETPKRAADSENYQVLLSVLRASTNPKAKGIAEDIARDTERFPRIAERDRNAILEAARRIGFDLAIFTNEMAFEHKYLFFKHVTSEIQSRRLPNVPTITSAILAVSPLSRSDLFRAALLDVASMYPDGFLDIILVAHSHGSKDMALMPRVSADLTRPGISEDFARRLALGDSADNPEWAKLQGTSKIDFWQAIADVVASRNVRFPLVFRESCSSGLSGWAEYFSIPDSVGALAHTDRADENPDLVDFAGLFAAAGPGTDWIRTFSTSLRSSGFHVDNRLALLVWPTLITLQSVPLALYFLPLVVWLIWYGLATLRATGKNRKRVGHAPR